MELEEIKDKFNSGHYLHSGIAEDDVESLLYIVKSLQEERDKYKEALKIAQSAAKNDTIPDFYLLARTINNITKSALNEP